MQRIYLDHNATTTVRPEVIAALTAALTHTGNASSIHAAGREARRMVEDARAQIAMLAGVRSAQVIFNGGATEGNNTILSGYQDKPVLVSAIEHPSVLEAAPHAQKIPVTRDGAVDLDAFKALLDETPGIALVCVQLVNSETGVIQPIPEIAELAHAKGARVHCDAVQGAGRIPLDFKSLGVDTLTLSAHKFGGPQGVGALLFREGLLLPKFMRGGGQEKRQRAGTENVAAIAGFGTAAQIALDELGQYRKKTLALQNMLETGLRKISNDLIIAGESARRVSNTTNVLLRGVSAETQLMAMDLEGICVSSGSACSSGTFKPSHVLAAMHFDESQSKSALRFSTGWNSTEEDVTLALAAYEKMVRRLVQ